MTKIIGNTTATPNPRPDWTQTDETKADYIKNKPTVLTEDEIKDLIDEFGGDNQVQADFNQTDETQHDFIRNKPVVDQTYTIGANAQSGTAVAEALNITTNNINNEFNHNFANALKGTKVGETVAIKDISPLEHDLVVTVGSKNLIPFNYVGIITTNAEGVRTNMTNGESNGVTFTVNGDGSITIDGEATGAITYTLISGSKISGTNITGSDPIDVPAGTYTVSVSADIPSGFNLWLRVVGTGGAVVNQSKSITVTEPTRVYSYITITAGTKIENLTIYPMVERGAVATAYTPYVADMPEKVYAQGEDGVSIEYAVNADGTVEGVRSMSPSITLTTDTSGVVVICQYNKDINQAFEQIIQAIISLGGNV